MLFTGRNQVPADYSRYGWTRDGGSRFHAGIDIKGLDSDQIKFPSYNKQTIRGTVRSSTIVTDTSNLTWQWGYYIKVELDEVYGNCKYLYFCHNKSNLVNVGQRVSSGDVIAIVGDTGNAKYAEAYTIPHCHLEARKTDGKTTVDPTPFAGVPNSQGTYEEEAPMPTGTLKYLDVSKFQPTIDYAACAKDIDGVILRIGLTYWGAYVQGKDVYFEQHYAGFKAQGVPVGVYYYSCADTLDRAEEEALYVLSLLKGKQFELPIYYDVENNERQGGLNKEQITAIVDKFCSMVEAGGYYVGYYSYTAWLLSKFDTDYLSSKYTLWKADYRTSYDTTIPCDMLQYTNSGVVSGINGRVDLNHCYKTDFEAVIKSKGLNGFSAVPYEPVALKIGYASEGDVKTLCGILDKDNAQYSVADGYIITEAIDDRDLEMALRAKAKELGIPCVEVAIEPTPEPPSEECEECAELKEENKAYEELIVSLTASLNEATDLLEEFTKLTGGE